MIKFYNIKNFLGDDKEQKKPRLKWCLPEALHEKANLLWNKTHCYYKALNETRHTLATRILLQLIQCDHMHCIGHVILIKKEDQPN